MKRLETWGGRSSFHYNGSVKAGTKIIYGKGWEARVTSREYKRLLDHFKGRRVPCGTSRTEPPPGSLGEWLMRNVTKTAIASYVGAILVKDNYAVKLGSDILFK